MKATMLRTGSSIALLLLLLLGGCAGTRTAKDPPAPGTDTPAGAVAATPQAWSPVDGTGLRSMEIPAVLQRAFEEPYARPQPLNCTTLGAAITELDAVLGPDLDRPVATADKENFALSALGSGLRGLIPYYGWIRRLTGVDRQERRALAAISAGQARRGYLKGLGEARGCALPARPGNPPPSMLVPPAKVAPAAKPVPAKTAPPAKPVPTSKPTRK